MITTILRIAVITLVIYEIIKYLYQTKKHKYKEKIKYAQINNEQQRKKLEKIAEEKHTYYHNKKNCYYKNRHNHHLFIWTKTGWRICTKCGYRNPTDQ